MENGVPRIVVALDMSNGVGYVGQTSPSYLESRGQSGTLTLRNFLRYITKDVLRELSAVQNKGKTFEEFIRVFYDANLQSPDGRENLGNKIDLPLEHIIERHEIGTD